MATGAQHRKFEFFEVPLRRCLKNSRSVLVPQETLLYKIVEAEVGLLPWGEPE